MLRQRHSKADSKDQSPSIPKQQDRKSLKKNSGKILFGIVFLVIVIVYGIVPVAFYVSPVIRSHAIFLHYVSLSSNRNLSLPSQTGLNCTENFYIDSDPGIKLGAWYVPSVETLAHCKNDVLLRKHRFHGTGPVFLYLHGNAGTRGGNHRVHLYKVLSTKVNAHVVAFDYRGYGDSSNVMPSEDGIVADAVHVYDWLRKEVSPTRIYIWGHSLGTGVATAVMEILTRRNTVPAGLILEAPFTKLIDAVKHHPLSFLHRNMPFFDFFIADPIGEETAFNSVDRIGRIKAPVLILHAEDDGFVPYYQGKKLYDQALAERPKDLYHTEFVGFQEELDYGHKHIHREPKLPDIIKQFIKNVEHKRS